VLGCFVTEVLNDVSFYKNLRGDCMFLIVRLAALKVTNLGTDETVMTVILSDKADNIKTSITVKDKCSDVTFRRILSAGEHCKSRVCFRIS
jgi:hypothetical protein